MFEMITGNWVSKMLSCVARLNVADYLVAGPRTTAELAARAACHEESLYRVLRALASLGVFREVGPKTFELTPKADYLRSDHPQSVRDVAYCFGDDLYEAWCDLFHSMTTGDSAVHKRFGGDFLSAVLSKPEMSAVFDRAMEQIHGP